MKHAAKVRTNFWTNRVQWVCEKATAGECEGFWESLLPGNRCIHAKKDRRCTREDVWLCKNEAVLSVASSKRMESL